ncbi:MAG: hypothetical protein ABSG91_16905 [Syntrophobacteraceae bacterium]|jgi:hypothetical protein
MKLQSVPHQILEELRHLPPTCLEIWQISDINTGAGFMDRDFKISDYLLDQV